MNSSPRIAKVAVILSLMSLTLTTCSEPESINCETGVVCPANRLCAKSQAVCLPIGSRCGNGIVETYTVVEQVATEDEAGNPTTKEIEREIKEECDDGNLINGDGCSDECLEEFCGNGRKDKILVRQEDGSTIEKEEVCDHGLGRNSKIDGKYCSKNCDSNLLCGNGVVDGDEVCDHGIKDYEEVWVGLSSENEADQIKAQGILTDLMRDKGKNDCAPNCASTVKCGDGILDNYGYLGAKAEICDPGTEENDFKDKIFDYSKISLYKIVGDDRVALSDDEKKEYIDQNAKCVDRCLSVQICGDGAVSGGEGGEECDPGVIDTHSANCTADCKLSYCGDSFRNEFAGEECDHGQGRDATQEIIGYESDCTHLCKKNICGDGIKGISENGQEECDMGPMAAECTSECKRSFCGDGFVNIFANEQCDHGKGEHATSDDVGKDSQCTHLCRENICGDGFHGADEECDDGPNGSENCTTDCKINRCGDGFYFAGDPDEECDHGKGVDATDKDVGTDSNCTHLCKINTCGDGIQGISENEFGEKVREKCDDGNEGSKTCTVKCTISQCGDGITNSKADETCDERGVTGEDNNVYLPPMKEALIEYCDKLNDDDDDLGPLKTPGYSFCKRNQNQKWEASVYIGDDNEKKKRRAAAEYHYNVEIVGNARLEGRCSGYNCRIVGCGNGEIDIGEVCDKEGNLDALTGEELPLGLRCSDDCRSTQICGNGIIDTGEVCDPPTNGCRACTSGQTCGNGIIDPNEQCDAQNIDNKGYCVITSSEELDESWHELEFTEEISGIGDETACETAKGVWSDRDSKCYVLSDCIPESVHGKCLISKGLSDCGDSLSSCYDYTPESSVYNDRNSCEGAGPDYKWMKVCIFKKCDLAYCGDGYIFTEAEKCDHGLGRQKSQEEFEGALTEKCSSDCKEKDEADCEEKCREALIKVGEDYCNYNCQLSDCGDGIVNRAAGEICDWGKNQNGLEECPNGATSCDVCSADCTSMDRLGCGSGNPQKDKCDHMEKKDLDGVECTDKDKTNCKYIGADKTQCESYPCNICEECAAPRSYYRVTVGGAKDSEISEKGILGKGSIVSDAIGLQCTSTSDTEGGTSGVCDIYTEVSGSAEQPVIIKAIPAEGWELQGWENQQWNQGWGLGTGNKCSFGGEKGRTLTCNSLIQGASGHLTISPTFVKAKYPVKASVEDSTGGTVSGTCTPEKECPCDTVEGQTALTATCTGESAAQVTFTATPADNYVFVKWENGCPIVGTAPDGSPTCAGDIGTGWQISAVFAKQYSLSYSVAAESAGMGMVSSTIDSGTKVNNGTSVTFIAAPNATYEFTGWTLSDGYTCDGGDTFQNPCTVTIKGKDLDAKANFIQSQATITAESFVVDGMNSNHLPGINFCLTNVETSCLECAQPGETEIASGAQQFNVSYASSYKICYTKSEFDDSAYRYAYWTGCSSYDETSCTISNVVNTENPVKIIFSKNKHNLHFGTKGLIAGETLNFTCSGSVSGTVPSCDSLFVNGETVTASIDTANSVCISGKALTLSVLALTDHTVSDVTENYTCECNNGSYDKCSSAALSVDALMAADRFISVSLTNSSELTLSSAQNGMKKDQLKGSLIGTQTGAGSNLTILSCNASTCEPSIVGIGSNIKLVATPEEGYQLTAWRIDNNYLSESNGNYAVNFEQNSISFTMSTDLDVTPVFTPKLSLSITPSNGGTLTATVTNCASMEDKVCSLPVIDTENSIYRGYSQKIGCEPGGASNECVFITDVIVAEIPVAANVEVRIVSDLTAGYTYSGWAGYDCESESECNVSISEPTSMILTVNQPTGSLNWTDVSTASSSELSEFNYMKLELYCKKRDKDNGSIQNCNDNDNDKRRLVAFISSETVNNNWSPNTSNDYYLVAVPMNQHRNVVLTCPANSRYRCVASKEELNIAQSYSSGYWDGYLWKGGWSNNRYGQINEVNQIFSSTSPIACGREPNMYAQCLMKYSSTQNTASAVYSDKTAALTISCNQSSGASVSGQWTNSGNQTTTISAVTCAVGGSRDVAQAAAVTLNASGWSAGHSLQRWELDGDPITECYSNSTCSFTMPSTAATITPVITKGSTNLTTVALPSQISGKFSCSDYESSCSENYSEAKCSASHEYGAKLCIKAIPISDANSEREFLTTMNGSGCPGGWTRDVDGNGICSNVVMTESRTVSAVFTEKPKILFNSNINTCEISCTSPSCTPSNSGSINVSTGDAAAFTANAECGIYEFLETSNQHNCPVANGGWTISGNNAICSIPSVTQAVNYVYAVYTEKPTLTQALGSAGGRLVGCDGQSTAAVGTTAQRTGDEIDVCAEANEHYSIELKDCPSEEGWKPTTNSKISKCTVTMNGDKSVIASFIHDASQIVNVSTIGDGTVQCQKTSDTDCPTEGYSAACETVENITTSQKLCIKATGDNAAHTEPSTCQGGIWDHDNDVCAVSYTGTDTKSVAILFTIKPKVTVKLTPQTGVEVVPCGDSDVSSPISDGSTYYATNTHVAVCVQADPKSYSLNQQTGCPSNWTIKSSGNETIYKCDLGVLSQDVNVYASFSVVAAEQSTVTVINNGGGESSLKCYTIKDSTAAPDCPTEDSTYTENCNGSYFIENQQKLCVKAISDTNKEFKSTLSSCAGQSWNDDICTVSYTDTAQQSVVATFVDKVPVNIEVHKDGVENNDSYTGYSITEGNCSTVSIHNEPQSEPLPLFYPVGQQLCIKAPVYDEGNQTMLDASKGCLWSSKDEGYYYCDVTVSAEGASVTMTVLSWPTLTNSASATVKKGACNVEGETVTFTENNSALIKPETPLCATVNVSNDSGEKLDGQNGCPGGAWTISNSETEAACAFTMGTENAVISASYSTAASEQPEQKTLTVTLDPPSIENPYTVAESACNSEGLIFRSAEANNSYTLNTGSSMCIKASTDIEGYTFNEAQGCNGGAWSSVVSDENEFFGCTVSFENEALSVALSYTAWPTLTVSVTDNVPSAYTIAHKACDASLTDSDFSAPETNHSYKYISETQLCIKASTDIEGYTFNEAQGCNDGEWSSFGSDENKFWGCTVSLSENTTVTLNYTASSTP